MNTKEFRIGNLLYFGDEVNRVYAIEENCFYIFTAEGVSLKNTTCDLKPIPLTEDILYDCGFLSFGSRFTHEKLPFDIINDNGFRIANIVYKIKYLKNGCI